MGKLSEEVRRFLEAARVAHLATADREGAPSVVPICFQVREPWLFSVIDEKPKRVAGHRLRRVRNLLENPRIAVVVDRWAEDWSRLGWVLLRGRGELLEPGDAHAAALVLLREKYPQYRAMKLEQSLLIRMEIESVRAWGSLGDD